MKFLKRKFNFVQSKDGFRFNLLKKRNTKTFH